MLIYIINLLLANGKAIYTEIYIKINLTPYYMAVEFCKCGKGIYILRSGRMRCNACYTYKTESSPEFHKPMFEIPQPPQPNFFEKHYKIIKLIGRAFAIGVMGASYICMILLMIYAAINGTGSAMANFNLHGELWIELVTFIVAAPLVVLHMIECINMHS